MSRATSPVAQCDRCERTFTPAFSEVELAGGGIRQEFTCPHCRMTYPILSLTAEGVQLRREVRQLRDRRRRGERVDPGEWSRTLSAYQREITSLR